MATSYTSLLGLALPANGDTNWGTTINDSMTSLVDSAVAGTTTLSSDADVTLSTTTGTANQARQSIILWTAGGTTTRYITAPAASKPYIVINKTSSTQSIVLRGVGPTTGITIAANESCVAAWNGSDFVKVSSSLSGVTTISFGSTGLTPNTATSGAVSVAGTLAVANGGTNATATPTAGAIAYGTGTAYAFTTQGVPGYLLTSNGASAPNWVSTLPVANGGTGQTTFTDGQLLIGNSTGNTLTKATLTAGSGVTITNSAGGITIAATGSGGTVTSVTASTPLASSGGATPDITLSGTVATANGGTGLSSFVANRVFYASSTSAVGQSANLTFDGDSLSVYGITVGRGLAGISTNTAVGNSALATVTSGAINTGIGYFALNKLTSGAYNTALGNSAALNITTGGNNTAVGSSALNNLTTGSNNIAVGSSALQGISTTSDNVAIGSSALFYNTVGENTAVGSLAASGNASNTTAVRITAIGYRALTANYGNDNTSVGYDSLKTNTTGFSNTAVGSTALFSNLGGYLNTAVGDSALYSNTSGDQNVGIGRSAGYTNSTGNANVYIGYSAGYLATGSGNTFIGDGAGDAVTTGANNVIIGAYSGNEAGLDIRTTSNQVVISDGSANIRAHFNGPALKINGAAATPAWAIGFSATAMTLDCRNSNVFTTTFTANVTTAPTLSNPQDGQTINWFITQDATGSRTMTWPTSFKWPGGTAGVLSTAANAVDLVTATYRSATGFWYASLLKAFS